MKPPPGPAQASAPPGLDCFVGKPAGRVAVKQWGATYPERRKRYRVAMGVDLGVKRPRFKCGLTSVNLIFFVCEMHTPRRVVGRINRNKADEELSTGPGT